MLENGKPIYCEIDTETKRMWWVMPDFETVRLFIATGKGWLEIPEEEWKVADIERASILPDIAREECKSDKSD
jgi:hypothetical protein